MEEPQCSAVTQRGQGHDDKNSINQGRGKMQCSQGNPAVSFLSTCARTITQTQPGDPQGRDLAVTAQPWAVLAQLDHTTKYKISVVASEACEIILSWQNVVSSLALD